MASVTASALVTSRPSTASTLMATSLPCELTLRLPVTGSLSTSFTWVVPHSETLSRSTLIVGAEDSLLATVIHEAFVSSSAV